MKKLLIILIGIIFISCASIINTDFTTINVFTVQDSTKLCIGNDTSNFRKTPTKIQVYRSKKPLKLTIKKDSINKSVFIPSNLSGAFWFGNILNGTLPYGHIVDLSNEKRFTYPSSILIDLNNINNTNFKYKNRQTWQIIG